MATRLPSGDIEVQIPWRAARNALAAGAPDHFMQFLYLRDEGGAIRAIAKFEPADLVFPYIFPASAVAGVAALTPYSADVVHGVWQGETVALS